MRLTHQDIVMSLGWAREHAGEDDPLDVYAHKMLSFALKQHEDAREYHDREIAKIQAEMQAIGDTFVVSEEGF